MIPRPKVRHWMTRLLDSYPVVALLSSRKRLKPRLLISLVEGVIHCLDLEDPGDLNKLQELYRDPNRCRGGLRDFWVL